MASTKAPRVRELLKPARKAELDELKQYIPLFPVGEISRPSEGPGLVKACPPPPFPSQALGSDLGRRAEPSGALSEAGNVKHARQGWKVTAAMPPLAFLLELRILRVGGTIRDMLGLGLRFWSRNATREAMVQLGARDSEPDPDKCLAF